MTSSNSYFGSLLLPVLLFGTWTGAVDAGTPDGMPPANEGVCDELQTATPGLFGLCVAYCEALDCPDIAASPSGLPPQCNPPNPNILALYDKLKRENDPSMPCVQTSCPCWSLEEVSAIGYSWEPHTMAATMWDFPSYDTFSIAEYRSGYPGAYQYSQVYYWDAGPQCVYAYADFDPNNYQYIVRFQDITETEAQACEAQILVQFQDLRDSGAIVPCGGNLCPPF